MSVKKQIDLTKGSIFRVLFWFMIPILLANLFQQLYNTVDTMIVGHYLGDSALAAMGAGSSIFDLLVGFATGVGTGFSVVIARYVGAKDQDGLKKTVATTTVLSLILTIIIMILSLFVLKPLMVFLNVPPEVFAQTHAYIFIVCICVGITLAYNLTAAMLRAKGNSFIPLISLLISSVLNVVLDLYFIAELHMAIEGAAIATVISQAVSALLCISYIFVKEKELVPSRHHFVYDKQLVADLIGQGLSMGLMLSIVSLGTLILQTAINKFGTVVIAAYTSARKIFGILMMPCSTLSSAVTTFVSQNAGARQSERIRHGVQTANRMAIGWGLIAVGLIYLSADSLIQLVSGSHTQQLIEIGSLYLKIAVPFFAVLGILLNLRSALQGLGRKIVPLFSSIVELVGKLIFTTLLIPQIGFLGICLAEPLIWCAMCLQLVGSYRHCLRDFEVMM